jgi:hypothetical protein
VRHAVCDLAVLNAGQRRKRDQRHCQPLRRHACQVCLCSHANLSELSHCSF